MVNPLRSASKIMAAKKISTPLQPVTVVVPSFNRAHLLEKTLPSYLQPPVAKLIVINDHSSDNSKEVLSKIAQSDPRIHIIHNPKNIKQTGSKNIGIDLAETEYIYFGDDDSYITPGSIAHLLDVAHAQACDIVSARALYFTNEKTEDELFSKYKRYAQTPIDVLDLSKWRFNFTLLVNGPMPVHFGHACFLIKTSLAKSIKFSRWYIGNCFREETDFLVRCARAGAKNYYTSGACQINLPRTLATGGSHQSGKAVKFIYTRVNALLFIFKNAFSIAWLIKSPAALIQLPFIMIAQIARKLTFRTRKLISRKSPHVV
jgi:glycosyltransferase involved in cell wall biosynthesis